MAADAIFAQLQLGAKFDTKKWKKQIELFDGPAPAAQQQAAPPPAAAAATEAPAAAGEGRKKKKQKTKHAAKAAVDHADPGGGIALFGGQEGQVQAELHAAADPAAAFVDSEPHVATGDPFEEANVIRKAHKIKVSGTSPPAPLRSFAELESMPGCSKRLLSNLAGSGFTEPTPIQRQAASALLGGRELLAIAPTGSGKTVAFLLPLVMRVRQLMQQEAGPEQPAAADEQNGQQGGGEGGASQAQSSSIKAVVVSPTKELSMQTARVLKLLLPGLRIRCSVLSKATAAGTDFSKVDILMAQPLRLGAMAEEGRVDLSACRLLVLDEADKLFDMGFTQQVDAVIAACSHRDCVRALFSATLPEAVENLARSVLKDPLRVTVGERNTAVSTVKQRLLFVGREEGKLLALRQLISEGLRPPVLVFVATKERAKELHRELMYDGVHVDSIHADQSQAARQAAVDNFRVGRTWVLVATDLIGRGMDFLGVNTVVNFDFPNSTTDYIHRVGRTGRTGRSGEAVTFFTEEDAGQLRSIANVMRATGCEVPAWMLELKKERRHRKRPAAPAAGGISTEPKAERQKGGKGGKGSSLGTKKGQPKQQRRQNGSGKQQQQVKSTKQQPKQKPKQQEQRPPKKKSRAAAAE
ncbi:hypothetical protein ABPG77_004226 [Micractinium sp. CCAP 211/92]